MGHYCWMCGRYPPNERFSGRGHRNHVCRDCNRLPKNQKLEITTLSEIEGFLDQSHISRKNLRRLQVLSSMDNAKVQKLAAITLDIAHFALFKRKRVSLIKRQRPELWRAMVEQGLVWDYEYEEEYNDEFDTDDCGDQVPC